jgi:hypothetical protein
MGKSELLHKQLGDRHQLYASGETRHGGAWCAVIQGRGNKYLLDRRFVGLRTPSDADPLIEVCIVDLTKIPDPCLLEVQAGGTKRAPNRIFVARRGSELFRLKHQRRDEITLLVGKNVSIADILGGLFDHDDVADGRISVTKAILTGRAAPGAVATKTA